MNRMTKCWGTSTVHLPGTILVKRYVYIYKERESERDCSISLVWPHIQILCVSVSVIMGELNGELNLEAGGPFTH